MTAARNRPQQIGVFGGAFDPPHAGHRALAEAALDQLQLDRLLVFPTGHAWHKSRGLSDARHRVAMVELAFADLPEVDVDVRETLRSGPSYTVDTLRELCAEYPGADLFLLIGQDQAQALQTWKEWQTVVQLAMVCVAAREHSTGGTRPFDPHPELLGRVVQLQFPMLPVSATKIRALAAAGQGVVPLVCEAVARYIAHHHLYQAA